MATPGNERGQLLLAEEYFANENDLFLPTLRQADHAAGLAALADRWKKDPRPWARQQLLAYLAQPLDCPGHQPLVKRLFKQAEEKADHEVMAAFVVAFDRQVRRRIKIKSRWDYASRTLIEDEVLATPRNVLPTPNDKDRGTRHPWTGDFISFRPAKPKDGRLFRHRTRYYLRRRVWRYFRNLGHRDPAAYVVAVTQALRAYTDADLARGENILDSWSLVHACFAHHDALVFGATHIHLQEGRNLGELTPAPEHADAWKTPAAAEALLALVLQAQAHLVTLWATQLFQREHPTQAVPWEFILSLLEHPAVTQQQFGSQLLTNADFLATLPVSSWLRLLQTKNEEALQRVCEAFRKNVSAERLTLAQWVELACARPAPVAQLGWEQLSKTVIQTAEERRLLLALAGARCQAYAGRLASWALAVLEKHYAADDAITFLDSRNLETRTAAWTWLLKDSPGLNDPVLWSRLTETPYDDLRLRVVDQLQRMTTLPGTSTDQLEVVWRTVLLGIHRGGRQKAKAVQQIARTLQAQPAEAPRLLPVLAVAVRSVRGPEMRAGLAAVATVVATHPELAGSVRTLLPELKLTEVPA